MLKERRRLVLGVREAPFHEIHLENMLKLARMGVIISPPVPVFYNTPRTVDDIVNHTVTRMLDLFGLHTSDTARWDGDMQRGDHDVGTHLSSLRFRVPGSGFQVGYTRFLVPSKFLVHGFRFQVPGS